MSSTAWTSESGIQVGSAVYFGPTWPNQPPRGETPAGSDQSLRVTEFSPPYKGKVPDIVLGINSLVMSTKEEMKFETDADNMTSQSFNLSMDTWGDTVIHEAEVTWLGIDPDDPELQSGGVEFSAPPRGGPSTVTEDIVFPYKFRKTPLVLVWNTGFDVNFPAVGEVGTYGRALNVTQSGFTLQSDFLNDGDTPRTDALFCNWLAISPDKKNVTCGSFDPQERDYYSSKTGRTQFYPTDKFNKVPRVFLGLQHVTRTSHGSGSHNAWGFKFRVTDVTKDDFGWSFEGADGTQFLYAIVAWIALC